MQRILDCGLISRVHIIKTEKKVKDKKKEEKTKSVEKSFNSNKFNNSISSKLDSPEKPPGSPKNTHTICGGTKWGGEGDRVETPPDQEDLYFLTWRVCHILIKQDWTPCTRQWNLQVGHSTFLWRTPIIVKPPTFRAGFLSLVGRLASLGGYFYYRIGSSCSIWFCCYREVGWVPLFRGSTAIRDSKATTECVGMVGKPFLSLSKHSPCTLKCKESQYLATTCTAWWQKVKLSHYCA